MISSPFKCIVWAFVSRARVRKDMATTSSPSATRREPGAAPAVSLDAVLKCASSSLGVASMRTRR